MQYAWDNLSQDDIRHLMIVCMREYVPALLPEEATLYIDVPIWAPLIALDPRFADLIPAGVDGFFQSVKILSMGEVKALGPVS